MLAPSELSIVWNESTRAISNLGDERLRAVLSEPAEIALVCLIGSHGLRCPDASQKESDLVVDRGPAIRFRTLIRDRLGVELRRDLGAPRVERLSSSGTARLLNALAVLAPIEVEGPAELVLDRLSSDDHRIRPWLTVHLKHRHEAPFPVDRDILFESDLTIHATFCFSNPGEFSRRDPRCSQHLGKARPQYHLDSKRGIVRKFFFYNAGVVQWQNVSFPS